MTGLVVPPLEQRLRHSVDTTAARVMAALQQELPAFARMDPGGLRRVRETVYYGLRRPWELATAEKPYTPADMEIYTSYTAGAAARGTPLAEIVTSHNIASRIIQQSYWTEARPGDEISLMRLGTWAAVNVPVVQRASQAAYLDALRHLGRHGTARRMLTDALLAGDPAGHLYAALGLLPATRHALLLVRVPGPDDAATAAATSAAAADTAVDDVLGAEGQLLWRADGPDRARGGPALDGDRTERTWTILLPHPPGTRNGGSGGPRLNGTGQAHGHPTCPQRVGRRVDALTGAITDALTGRGLREHAVTAVTASCVAVPDLPAAYGNLRRLLRLAPPVSASGRTARPAAWRDEDLLLEQAVVADPTVHARLARLVDTLADNPALLTTLRAFYANNLERGSTAAALFIHRHTLDQRLRRIAALTGVRPTTARGIALLYAALTAHDDPGRHR
jgi:hypothetical protein